MNKIVKEKIKEAITLFLIIIIFVGVLAIMLKYENEGEKNMPYKLSEMLVVSSAEEYEKPENPDGYKWNMNINQYNDIYINIQKSENMEEAIYIDNISIENLKIEAPEDTKVIAYMPNDDEKNIFKYDDEHKIEDTLTYNAGEASDYKKLEVGKEGGIVLFRIVNQDVAEYVSNDDGELKYDGTLLKNANVSEDKLKIRVNFDVVIKTNKTGYRGNITIDLPSGDVKEEGVSRFHQTDFENIIFKRDINKNNQNT